MSSSDLACTSHLYTLVHDHRGWLAEKVALPTCSRDRPARRLGKNLVTQRLAGLQGMCDALLRFLFAAERDECLALEVQQVLLAPRWRSAKGAARQDGRELSCDVRVVIGRVPAALQ